jgi:hypothetical protein
LFACVVGSLAVAGATGTDDAGSRYYRIDTTPPQPPSPVYVVNLPGTLPVAGTVSVGNFPGVQSVTGAVSISNLPLAPDGSVRVAPPPARQPSVVELLTEPIDAFGIVDVPTIVNTSGYSSVGIYIQGSQASVTADTYWRWRDDEPFAPVVDLRSGAPGTIQCRVQGIDSRYVCPNLGGSMKIRLEALLGPTTVTSIRVYLFP